MYWLEEIGLFLVINTNYCYTEKELNKHDKGDNMQPKMIAICSMALLVVGCTHTNDGEMRFLPGEYISDVKYNSIYHYGYNQGCESALAKAKVAGYSYNQDITLENRSIQFTDGWQQGYSACEAGKEVMLYNLSKIK